MHASLVASAVVTLALAACLDPGTSETPQADLPVPEWDVEASVDWWEAFATGFQKRDSYLPANEDARQHLVDRLEALGFQVEVRTYEAGPRGGPGSEEAGVEMSAIVATLEGSEFPDRRIGLVSHYDTQTLTLQGAYDDASGVAAEMTICEALTAVQLRHTLACIFFDGEEQGLVASDLYVDDVTEGDEDFVYDIVFGYDMTGINWPGHEWKMYVMTGDADWVPILKPVAERVMHEQLAYPMSGVEVLDTHDRNSDERRFRDVGIPIYRFAGGRHAADYDAYHMPHDTVDHVYEVTAGRSNFEQGFATVVDGSLALILEVDSEMPRMP